MDFILLSLAHYFHVDQSTVALVSSWALTLGAVPPIFAFVEWHHEAMLAIPEEEE